MVCFGSITTRRDENASQLLNKTAKCGIAELQYNTSGLFGYGLGCSVISLKIGGHLFTIRTDRDALKWVLNLAVGTRILVCGGIHSLQSDLYVVH